MPEPEIGRPQGRRPNDGRPSASSMIAEMWSEREQSLPAPPTVPAAPRGHRGPKPPRDGGRTGLLVAVVALGLVFGGGLGVFMATQGVGMPSAAKFAAKADKVCGPANTAAVAITKPTSYPDLSAAAGTLVTATDAQLKGLGSLKRPGGTDGGRVTALLSAMTDANAAGHSLKDAAGRKDDAATAAATQQLRTSAADASSKAKELGFSSCALGMQSGIDSVTGGATSVVKTAFVAKADTLCRTVSRTLEAIPIPKTGNAAIGRYMTQTLQIMQKWVADIKALPVPPGDEAVVADLVASLDKMTAKWAEAPGAASAGDVSRLTAIDREMSTLSTASDAKLDAYGLGVCGSNFGG